MIICPSIILTLFLYFTLLESYGTVVTLTWSGGDCTRRKIWWISFFLMRTIYYSKLTLFGRDPEPSLMHVLLLYLPHSQPSGLDWTCPTWQSYTIQIEMHQIQQKHFCGPPPRKKTKVMTCSILKPATSIQHRANIIDICPYYIALFLRRPKAIPRPPQKRRLPSSSHGRNRREPMDREHLDGANKKGAATGQLRCSAGRRAQSRTSHSPEERQESNTTCNRYDPVRY